jgi:uncharacterized protein
VKGRVAFLSGLLFGVGLAVSGMTRPAKIIGFLDFFGRWDPTLLFVMAGAVGAYAAGLRLARRRAAPYLGTSFEAPSAGRVDARLLGGSALFGAGWGLSGFCPGPAVVAVGALAREAFVFLPAMLAGMWLYRRLLRDGDGADACG